MNVIRLGLIGDEPGPASFLGAYLNTPLGFGAEVLAKKASTSQGEQCILEITSCQWQNDSWLEIKNPVVKYSDGFMFIVQPFGSGPKMRTIRKIVSSILKVRGKLPFVVISNELLQTNITNSFDESLIQLQTLFSVLRCPILRTTAARNERILSIMFGEIIKLIQKHDYSSDLKGTNLLDFESTIIPETDMRDDMFSGPTSTRIHSNSNPSSPSVTNSNEVVLADPHSLSASTPSFSHYSSSAPVASMTNSSPPKVSPLYSPPIQSRVPQLAQSSYNSPKPDRPIFAESSNSPRLHTPPPDPATQLLDPLRSRTEIHNPELHVPDHNFRTASPRIDSPLSHLHEKMASTLTKSATSHISNTPGPVAERSISYSEISLKHSDSANLQLHFKHVDDRPDEVSSPWEDGSNVRKTRRDTDLSKRSRPRKFPPTTPPAPDPIIVTSSGDEYLEDLLSHDVKVQRAHLQQQILARKAQLEKESELEEVICKIAVIGAPKSGKTSFIEDVAQIATSFAVFRDGLEEGVMVYFEKHLQKSWRCSILEPARERKVAYQLALSNADAFIIVYNICSRQTYELVPTLFQEILEAKQDLKGPIMVIGTRLDEAQTREVMREEGQKAAQTIGSGVIFHEISSKTHQNVHTSFPSLLNSFLLRKFKPPSLTVKTSGDNNNNNRGKGSAPNTPTSSVPSSPGSLNDSGEIVKPFTLDSSSTMSREGKSSGKMLSNLCQSMREVNSGLKRKKKQFFTGADAIEWIALKTQASQQDAELWCQKLMTGGYIRPIIMVDVSDVSISIDASRSKFLGGDELYLFDGDSSASNRVLNDRRTTVSGRSPLELSYLALDICYHSLHFYLRVKTHHYEVNFRDWEKSSHFDKFSLLAGELQRVDFTAIKSEKCRLAFWINAHNVLAMHSCATYGPPCKEKKRKNFFEALYQVGDASVFSMQDILHGILRNNAKMPGMSKRQFADDDPRVSLVLPADPRVHFALWHGTKSSPFFGIYDEDDVIVLLQYATHEYLEREVELSYQKNTIILPKVFSTYAMDFGKDITEILLWISTFFNSEKSKLLKCIMHQDPDIRYKEYDWTATPPELLIV